MHGRTSTFAIRTHAIVPIAFWLPTFTASTTVHHDFLISYLSQCPQTKPDGISYFGVEQFGVNLLVGLSYLHVWNLCLST
jgi:hypothetical protein